MSNKDVWKRVDYGYNGHRLKGSLSIEIGPEFAEVVRDVISANPEATGYTLPIPVEGKENTYLVMTNTPAAGTAGHREIFHVNGKVRKIHESIELPHSPRMKGTKLEFDLIDAEGRKPHTKRVWSTLAWKYL
ncbi:hypothetical protein GOV10_02430 [Candidatus Woesearchaeota archaeon]|nr:hypothetical protein [Candidatus Woesearchaeota archaeon]